MTVPQSLAAAERRDFSIPAEPLNRAIVEVARQGGIDIGSTEAGLANVPAIAIDGRMTPAAALRRVLAATPYRAQPAGRGFRIVRRDPRRGPAKSPAPRPAIAAAAEPGDLTVIASKRDAGLLRFPGSVTILSMGPDGRSSPRFHDIAESLPILQSTNFGSGRDKLFVRGVADSSFIGPTQSTASVYFGGVQLGYSGPDPDLRLYDVERIEVLEGPQGTLYGAGTIGGVIQIIPRAPDLSGTSGAATAEFSATQGGAPGYDLAAMLNLPLADDRLGLRVVAYRGMAGGYIDDLGRGKRDVNKTSSEGGRAALRGEFGDGWTLDLGVIGQKIDAADAQYASRDAGRLARSSVIAQPFAQDYLLGRAVLTRLWQSGLKLVAATGYVDHHADDRFDATRPRRSRSPLSYDTANHNQLLTQEIRLSRTARDGDGWLVGAALLYDRNAIDRQFGPPGQPMDIVGVTNRTTDYALFGEATHSVIDDVAVTAGLRVTRAGTDGEPTASARVNAFVHGRRDLRLNPTAGLSWRLAPRTVMFARYQSGFRSGGLAVARGIGRVADFRADTIHVGEIGLRVQPDGPRGLGGSVALSHTGWRDIQADLIDQAGFPFTANIGHGRIAGLEAAVDWSPVRGLALSSELFVDRDELRTAPSAAGRPVPDRLPNTPRFAGAGSLDYAWKTAAAVSWRARGEVSYVGHSVLGRAPLLDIRQGGYILSSLSFDRQQGPVRLSLRIDNLGNVAGDRFALGNPFGVTSRNQTTPLRPRTFRLSLDYGL